VSLIECSNGASVFESYLDQPVVVRIIGGFEHIRNLATGSTLNGGPLIPAGRSFFRPPRPGALPAARQYGCELQIEPRTFAAFREQP
jgi:hypothetical protein